MISVSFPSECVHSYFIESMKISQNRNKVKFCECSNVFLNRRNFVHFLAGVALIPPCLHQEHPKSQNRHLAGSWSSPGSQAGHSSPAAAVAADRSLVAAVALSAAVEQSSAAAESAAAAC